MKVLEYYTRTLVKYKVIQGNCANLTKGKIFMMTKSYKQNRATSSNYDEIIRCLNICITLYHASELLIRHGLRSFLTFFDEHIDKPLIKRNTMVREIMADVREYLGPPPQVLHLPSGDVTEISPSVKFGHPKFYKLRDILIDHFKESNNSSRVIVFFEYRESVNEAYALLIQSKPTINPRIFVGQKQGVTQKIQINVIKQFREGTCNVLLSTSIGEEGLDVGEVDLIICFDISNKSPIRMVQRMGRTGRKKDGNIIVLVTEGKEQQTLKDCLIHKNNVANHVLGSKHLVNCLKGECPRLVPDGVVPKCEKIFITVEKPVAKKGSTLKDMLRTLSSKSSEPSFSPNLQITDYQKNIPESQLLATTANALSDNTSVSNTFAKRIEKQRSFQETHKISHSENCKLLVNLLQIAESRRFNIPMTQISNSSNNKQLKQTDIRNMFFKSQSAKDFDISPTQIPTIPEIPIVTEENLFPGLLTEITTFLSICCDTNSIKCNICPTEFKCEKNTYKNCFATTLNWIELDPSVYTSVTVDDLKLFEKGLDKSDDSFQFEETLDFSVPDIPINNISKEIVLELGDLIDNSILGDFCNKTANYEAPKSLSNLLNTYSTSIIDEQFISEKNTNKIENDSTEEKSKKIFSDADIKCILIFFKLDHLNDIFEEDFIPDSQETITYSPDLFEESVKTQREQLKTPVQNQSNSDDSCSPILCTFTAKKNKPTVRSHTQDNIKKKLPETSSPSLTTFSRKGLTSTPLTQKVPRNETTLKSTDKSNPNSLKKQRSKEFLEPNKTDVIELEDLFDFSSFGLPTSNIEKSGFTKIISMADSFSPDDFCETPLMKTSSQNSKINSNVPEKNTKNIDTSHLDDFVDEDLLEIFKPICDITEIKTSHSTINIKTTKSLDFINETRELDIEGAENKNINLVSEQLNQNTKTMETKSDCASSQTTVTQILSTINKPTQSSNPSQISKQLNQKIEMTMKNKSNYRATSQITVTQTLSTIIKQTQPNKSSQKENVENNVLDDDFDFFQFGLNKKVHKHISSEKIPKHTKAKLNDSSKANLNISSNTSLNSSRSSVNTSHESVSLSVFPKRCGPNKSKTVDTNKSNNISTKSLSEDEFDTKPKSPVWLRPKQFVKKRKNSDNDSDSDFESSSVSPLTYRSQARKKPNLNRDDVAHEPKRKKLINQFIEDEADVSVCDSIVISDDEFDTGTQDKYDASFVADETQDMDTQMHAVYLKSVRSPLIPSRFKIPYNVKTNVNILPQQENNENDTYLDDSFVVHDETIEARQELSQLEILEKKLEMRRKHKKTLLGLKKTSQKKRIVYIDSDSE
ncbi:unnamed protein product [Psylliodes chrysocephalus]|uniref:Helicase C-terminal domain-containing protein n=1 Tax=Psylliodes chrysocephalus TaxID=3402493 RepID=A0A9P0CYD7_9CUCU|nr:unnamed protein product [Psylliodes chrysocephala]